MLGFNDTSTLEGHFVSSPREREKRDSRGDESGGQGRKRNRNESEETEEIKTFPLYPFTSILIVIFKLDKGDGRLIMKGSVQYNTIIMS